MTQKARVWLQKRIVHWGYDLLSLRLRLVPGTTKIGVRKQTRKYPDDHESKTTLSTTNPENNIQLRLYRASLFAQWVLVNARSA